MGAARFVQTGDAIVSDAESAKVEEVPAPTLAQEKELLHLETDLASGVAWHPGTFSPSENYGSLGKLT